MSNVHRIQWFDQQIREGLYPNSSRLAAQFEISRRQAQRDIEYMENSLLAPLQYMAKQRGYMYADKTYMLPLLYMTEEEKQVLHYLAFRYREYDHDNAAAFKRISHLLERFVRSDEALVFGKLPIFETNSLLLETVQLLASAIQQRKAADILYKEGAAESRLRVFPLKLESRYNADYLLAYCADRGGLVSLRLDGIRSTKLTDETFEMPLPTEQGQTDSVRPAAKKPFSARLRFVNAIDAATWGGYPIRLVNEDQYEVEFYDAELFLQHLLVAEWKRLDAPKWLRQNLAARCAAAMNRLNEES